MVPQLKVTDNIPYWRNRTFEQFLQSLDEELPTAATTRTPRTLYGIYRLAARSTEAEAKRDILRKARARGRSQIRAVDIMDCVEDKSRQQRSLSWRLDSFSHQESTRVDESTAHFGTSAGAPIFPSDTLYGRPDVPQPDLDRQRGHNPDPWPRIIQQLPTSLPVTGPQHPEAQPQPGLSSVDEFVSGVPAIGQQPGVMSYISSCPSTYYSAHPQQQIAPMGELFPEHLPIPQQQDYVSYGGPGQSSEEYGFDPNDPQRYQTSVSTTSPYLDLNRHGEPMAPTCNTTYSSQTQTPWEYQQPPLSATAVLGDGGTYPPRQETPPPHSITHPSPLFAQADPSAWSLSPFESSRGRQWEDLPNFESQEASKKQ